MTLLAVLMVLLVGYCLFAIFIGKAIALGDDCRFGDSAESVNARDASLAGS